MKKILNCPMEYICSKSWNELQMTDDLNIKFCNACNKEVHLCEDALDLEVALEQNLCIAFQNQLEIKLERRMTLGIPKGFGGFKGGL